MDIILKELLNKTLIVPYEDEVVERLEGICNEYVTDDDFNDDDVAELAVMVLTHKPDSALKEKLEESYEAKYSESFMIPKSVCEMMAVYCLMQAIEQNKLTFYLALLNTMIIQCGQLEHLPYASFFSGAIEKALQAIDVKCKMADADENAFIIKLFSDKGDALNAALGEEDKLAMKRLARNAWYYKTKEYINGEQLKGLTTYAKVFKGLEHVVASMPQVFFNEHAIQQIKELVPTENAKEKTVEEIVKMIRPYYNTERELSCKSSVLLHLIADEENSYAALPFMKTKMTVRQFAVWLYYELLLEKHFD